jgi:hypothetical protein
VHCLPGVAHLPKEHNWPPAQHAAPHASAASQQVPPAQMPPSPQGAPSEQAPSPAASVMMPPPLPPEPPDALEPPLPALPSLPPTPPLPPTVLPPAPSSPPQLVAAHTHDSSRAAAPQGESQRTRRGVETYAMVVLCADGAGAARRCRQRPHGPAPLGRAQPAMQPSSALVRVLLLTEPASRAAMNLRHHRRQSAWRQSTAMPHSL